MEKLDKNSDQIIIDGYNKSITELTLNYPNKNIKEIILDYRIIKQPRKVISVNISARLLDIINDSINNVSEENNLKNLNRSDILTIALHEFIEKYIKK